MRQSLDGPAGLVQSASSANVYGGHVFVIRSEFADLIKVLWWDGQSRSLLAQRLEHGRFVWPRATSGSNTALAAFTIIWSGKSGAFAKSSQENDGNLKHDLYGNHVRIATTSKK
jgi:transposase